MWQPDETLRVETSTMLDDMLATLSAADPSDPRARAVARGALEAAGTLVFLGLAEDARRALDRAGAALAHAAHELVRSLEAEPLERALVEVLELAPELQLSPDDELPQIEERIVDALSVRDGVELLLAGAHLVLGDGVELDADLESSIMTFDELLGRELWRLVPLGSRRAARAAWAAPALRPRLWWWHRGADLPHSALSDLGTAARLIQIFPEAKEELERMLQAERDLDALRELPPGPSAADRPTERVIVLEVVRRRPGLAEGLALAAGGGEAEPLIELAGTPEIELHITRRPSGRLEASMSDDAGILPDASVLLEWQGPTGSGSVLLEPHGRGLFVGEVPEPSLRAQYFRARGGVAAATGRPEGGGTGDGD
jgi:hypothetical protein